MDIILIVRWAIFLTFILLTVEGVAGFIVCSRFYRSYVLKHADLEVRINALELAEKHRDIPK